MTAVSTCRHATFGPAVLLLSAACSTACVEPDRCRIADANMPPVRTPAPPPFTIGEIRSAMHVGRKDRFVAVGSKMAPELGDIEVVTAKDDTYQLHTESFELPGWISGEATIRVPAPHPKTWLDVMEHAGLFDKDLTTIRRLPCDTPLGRKDCIIYTAEDRKPDRDNIVVRSFYVRSLPGPPIMTTIRLCRTLLYFSAILNHTDAPEGDKKAQAEASGGEPAVQQEPFGP